MPKSVVEPVMCVARIRLPDNTLITALCIPIM